VRNVDSLFKVYHYGEAGRQIYEFFWSEFADWYLEIAKLQIEEGHSARLLVETFDTCLRLLHPFMPFVTEELWQHLKKSVSPTFAWEEALIIAKWPAGTLEKGWEAEAVHAFELIKEIVVAIRNARAEKGVEPSRKVSAKIQAGDFKDLLESFRRPIAHLARIDEGSLEIETNLSSIPSDSLQLVIAGVEVFLPHADLFDRDAEMKRIQREYEQIAAQIARLEQLLASDFADKAPNEVVANERRKLEEYRDTVDKLEKQLAELH
jgi:valyl-tRNA synthetase